MAGFFNSLLQMSIMASWLIIAVVVLRLFLKRVPRSIVCCLWALVAIRLICPFTIESSFSLIPNLPFMQSLNMAGSIYGERGSEIDGNWVIDNADLNSYANGMNGNSAIISGRDDAVDGGADGVNKDKNNLLNGFDTNNIAGLFGEEELADGIKVAGTVSISNGMAIGDTDDRTNVNGVDKTGNTVNGTVQGTDSDNGNKTGNLVGNQTHIMTDNTTATYNIENNNINAGVGNVFVAIFRSDKGIIGIIPYSVVRAMPFVWLAGVEVLLIYALISYIRLRKRTAASINIENNVYLCDDINTPFILGAFQPKIYLPSVLGEDMREYVLAHEKAHLKRFDNIWKPLGYIILCAHWFNPFVWIFYILLCKDIEIACDERVISDKDIEYKKQYASTLLSCSANTSIISACPLAFGEVSVKERIRAVLNYKKPAFFGILAAVVLCVAVIVGFMTSPKQSGNDMKGNSEIVADGETDKENDTLQSAKDVDETQQTDTENESKTDNLEESEDNNPEYNEGETLSVMEQFELADDKLDFLRMFAGDSESYKYSDTGKRMFDSYAAELSEINPEKYEKLKDPITSLSTIMDVEPESAEIFYSQGYKIVVLHLDTGDDIAYGMRQRGELWMPFMSYIEQSDNYAKYREYDRFIDKLTADKMRTYDDRTLDDGFWEGHDWDFVVLDSIESEDTVLYGSYDVSTSVLRRGNQIIPVPLSWGDMFGRSPEMHVADYDNDGSLEYAIKISTESGTGISGSELYIIETDWEEDENGKVEYTINEYQVYYSHQELDAFDFQYDDEEKVLTVLYNDEFVGTLDLSELSGDYAGVTFGCIYGVDYVDGDWYFNAKGLINRANTAPSYDWGILFEGRIVYDGQSFHLEDTQVQLKNPDSE